MTEETVTGRAIRLIQEEAAAKERERCATIALEQRCERGTPWDLACVAIAKAIRATDIKGA